MKSANDRSDRCHTNLTMSSVPSIPTATTSTTRIVLLLFNPSKGTNWGSILRCATAFGVDTVYMVGFAQCAVQGSKGAHKHVHMVAFPTAQQALDSLGPCHVMGLLGCLVDGYDPVCQGYPVEPTADDARTTISKGSVTADTTSIRQTRDVTPQRNDFIVERRSYAVHHVPLILEAVGPCNTLVLALSKHRDSLSSQLATHCSCFVHVPCDAIDTNNGKKPSSLLDQPVCLSIVLHHVTNALHWSEHDFEGHKFQVNTKSPMVAMEQQNSVREERERQRQILLDTVEDMTLDDVFIDS
jgi:hypothetical protein